jgi:hypothetical protein
MTTSKRRRQGGPGLRRKTRSGGGVVALTNQIIAAYAGAGWVVPDLFLARASDVSLVSGAVATWANRGLADDLTQGTSTARPAFSETALDGRPGLSFDGGDHLARGAYDLSAYTALVQHVVFLDTTAALSVVAEMSANAAANNGAQYVAVNGAAGTVRAVNTGNGVSSITDSTAETMASPHVITATWDQALATNETFLRRDGVDFTGSRVANSNTSGGMGNHTFNVGARSGISFGLTGVIAAVIVAAGATAIPLTAVASIEALLAAEYL